jgi:hypothetical protein
LNELREAQQAALTQAQGTIRQLETPEQAAARGEAMAARLREAQDAERFAELCRLLLTITLFLGRKPQIVLRVPRTA